MRAVSSASVRRDDAARMACSAFSTSPLRSTGGPARSSSMISPPSGGRCSRPSNRLARRPTRQRTATGISLNGRCRCGWIRFSRSPAKLPSGQPSTGSGRSRNDAALPLAWITTRSGSRTSSNAPCGWTEAAKWICSRSQFERSACPKRGIVAMRDGMPKLGRVSRRCRRPRSRSRPNRSGQAWHKGSDG